MISYWRCEFTLTVHRTYTPQQPLASFVHMFWLFEGYYPAHTKERVLPNGSLELIVNLREDVFRVYDRHNLDRFRSFRGCLITGTHSEYSIIDTSSQASMIGIHFKPGGAFPFLGVPASELYDEVVSLDTLWGMTACDLRDQLLEAATPEAKFRVLEQSLLERAGRSLERHPAVAFALNELQAVPHTRNITDVIQHTGLSQRRFIQVFKDEVGLTPKLFCRIRRFQEALHLIRNGERVDWMDIALTCGYFDQAHFIHDFRAFSGINPTAYLTAEGEQLNHVPLGE